MEYVLEFNRSKQKICNMIQAIDCLLLITIGMSTPFFSSHWWFEWNIKWHSRLLLWFYGRYFSFYFSLLKFYKNSFIKKNLMESRYTFKYSFRLIDVNLFPCFVECEKCYVHICLFSMMNTIICLYNTFRALFLCFVHSDI